MNIGDYTFSEFKELARSFHGYPAPGLLIGGFMVEAVKRKLPEGTLFEALIETAKCLPDAVQLLTLCSTGNGWMRVNNLGRYAVSLYDKYSFDGWRAAIDLEKLEKFPEIKAWFLKEKTKKEQDTDKLFEEIEKAGDHILTITPVHIRPQYQKHKTSSPIIACPICSEAYPKNDGAICRGCQGENPYQSAIQSSEFQEFAPALESIPVENAIGEKALHDMTRIVPGKSKGPEFKAGQTIEGGDLCRLQQMGRSSVYVEGKTDVDTTKWIHENDAVTAFAPAIAGSDVYFNTPPKEGKIDFFAKTSGLLTIDEDRLLNFNLVPNVMCTSRQNNILVDKDRPFAGCRAIPLYLAQEHFQQAMACLNAGPLFNIIPLKQVRVGILVTGTEVALGLIEDKFDPIIRSKVEKLNCTIAHSTIVADDADQIAENIGAMVDLGVDLIVTTAGLSVDPDDQTRKGLIQAGLSDALYGAPILPGAMTLVGKIKSATVIGVPACALFHKTTSFDLLLPRILAGQTITRMDLAKMAVGGFCLNCNTCTFPKCPFGK
jgi:formylmethanofuran dehydrogenase subunit E